MAEKPKGRRETSSQLVSAPQAEAMARSRARRTSQAKRRKRAGGELLPEHLFEALLAAHPNEKACEPEVAQRTIAELLKPRAILSNRRCLKSEMLARPALALSWAAAATAHGARDLLEGTAQDTMAQMAARLTGGTGRKLLKSIQTLSIGHSQTVKQASIRKAIAAYAQFWRQADGNFDSAVARLVAVSSRLYLLGVHLAEQRAFFSRPARWARRWRPFPAPAALRQWLCKPKDSELLRRGLAHLLLQEVSQQKKPKRPGQNSDRAGPSCSSRRSKNHKRSRARQESLAEAKAVMQPMEEPATARCEVAIHRIGGIGTAGAAAVREGDPTDTVECSNWETVESAVRALLRAQGSLEDRKNWRVKVLDPDYKLRSISTEIMLARECPHVALVRKGG